MNQVSVLRAAYRSVMVEVFAILDPFENLGHFVGAVSGSQNGNGSDVTVRLPQPLVADIEAESPGRNISQSDVVRERLERAPRRRGRAASLERPSPISSGRWTVCPPT